MAPSELDMPVSRHPAQALTLVGQFASLRTTGPGSTGRWLPRGTANGGIREVQAVLGLRADEVYAAGAGRIVGALSRTSVRTGSGGSARPSSRARPRSAPTLLPPWPTSIRSSNAQRPP